MPILATSFKYRVYFSFEKKRFTLRERPQHCICFVVLGYRRASAVGV
jgi:hypothetical protein